MKRTDNFISINYISSGWLNIILFVDICVSKKILNYLALKTSHSVHLQMKIKYNKREKES